MKFCIGFCFVIRTTEANLAKCIEYGFRKFGSGKTVVACASSNWESEASRISNCEVLIQVQVRYGWEPCHGCSAAWQGWSGLTVTGRCQWPCRRDHILQRVLMLSDACHTSTNDACPTCLNIVNIVQDCNSDIPESTNDLPSETVSETG